MAGQTGLESVITDYQPSENKPLKLLILFNSIIILNEDSGNYMCFAYPLRIRDYKKIIEIQHTHES